MTTRSYSELSQLETFDERYEYLRLNSFVGSETFGHERWINQRFYRSNEWRQVRTYVIARDLGYDLGVEGYNVVKAIQVHHMNPMTVEQLERGAESILDPEFLISASHETHNAIHYGAAVPRQPTFAERKPGDTLLW